MGYSYGTSTETIPEAYLLPESHPIKPFLDYLFSQSRVILNLDTLEEAGFIFDKPRKFTNLIIAKHFLLPGYIFKLYLDAQREHKDKPEHYFWMLRIEGAFQVRQIIENYRLQEWAKVPQKWIYVLPSLQKVPSGYKTKKTILVEEDMQILSQKENEDRWSSAFVSPEHLFSIYLILTHVGLSDCAKPDNMPFSKDGRISFIDTQTYGREVPLEELNSWLSDENQVIWKHFID